MHLLEIRKNKAKANYRPPLRICFFYIYMHLFFLVFPATLGNTRKKTFGVGDQLLKNSMHEARGCGEDYNHGGGWDYT